LSLAEQPEATNKPKQSKANQNNIHTKNRTNKNEESKVEG
jgi:hypothetical protein